MNKPIDVESAAIFYITQGRDGLLKAIEPLLKQRNELYLKEAPEFRSEIDNQFDELVRKEVANKIAVDLGFEADKVYDIVKTLDVKAFLKGI